MSNDEINFDDDYEEYREIPENQILSKGITIFCLEYEGMLNKLESQNKISKSEKAQFIEEFSNKLYTFLCFTQKHSKKLLDMNLWADDKEVPKFNEHFFENLTKTKERPH